MHPQKEALSWIGNHSAISWEIESGDRNSQEDTEKAIANFINETFLQFSHLLSV